MVCSNGDFGFQRTSILILNRGTIFGCTEPSGFLFSSAFQLKVSSLHITFPSEGEFSKLKDSEFLQRIGMQYHWRNRDYRRYARC